MNLAPSPRTVPKEPTDFLAWLKSFIAESTPEDSSLDYKSGDSLNHLSKRFREEKGTPLAKGEKAKDDISKDVSAFANAGGGILVYGIGEASATNGQVVPASFVPVRLDYFSQEQLDQLISAIRPRIEGYLIRICELPEADGGGACVVVEIAQSSTAHQATDKKYYRRRHSTTEPMEDYEIREVMGRIQWPHLEVALQITRNDARFTAKVAVQNIGHIKCDHYHIDLIFPKLVPWGAVIFDEPTFPKKSERGWGQLISLSNKDGRPLLLGRNLDYTFNGTFGGPNGVNSADLQNEACAIIHADNAPPRVQWLAASVWIDEWIYPDQQ